MSVSSASSCIRPIPLPKKLSNSQRVMKCHYDRAAVPRHFQMGNKVLALLPIPGSVLSAKFTCWHDIRECLRDTDYVISTPERRRKTRVAMLKCYYSRETSETSQEKSGSVQASIAPGSCALIVTENISLSDDDLMTRHIGWAATLCNWVNK